MDQPRELSRSAVPLQVTVRHEREVVTYGYLWHASRVTLELGESGIHGSAWQYMSSALLTAFSVEAFLNHFGASLFPDWQKMERRKSPMQKLALVAKEVGVDLGEDSARPMSTLVALFDLRNSLAHGRTENLLPPDIIADARDDIDRMLVDGAPRTSWEQKIRTSKFATDARADVDRILQLLHEAIPEPKDSLYFTGMHMSSASAIR